MPNGHTEMEFSEALDQVRAIKTAIEEGVTSEAVLTRIETLTGFLEGCLKSRGIENP